jgi:GNAT superfamily N-acetyltransferase
MVVVDRGEPIGLLQYRRVADQLEVVVVIARRRRQGVGRRLLAAAKAVARVQACRRLWLITTNDNRSARARSTGRSAGANARSTGARSPRRAARSRASG